MVNIKEIIDKLRMPAASADNSMDRLCFGEPQAEVKGIAVTFMATQSVLERAAQLGANLVITHEGLFYSHHDQSGTQMEHNQVAAVKKRYLEEHGLAVYRFHDDVHRYQPDGIMEGLVQALGWQGYVTGHLPEAALLSMPSLSVGEVIGEIKQKLSLRYVRVIGDLSEQCSRIALLAGYRGGAPLTIPLFEQYDVDLILYGEGPEWETPEFVRDARYGGKKRALVVLGHLESEQPGMELAAHRLREQFPMIPVHFLQVEPVFQVV